eukprot:5297230-Prorocentrum_lima.AAC.1
MSQVVQEAMATVAQLPAQLSSHGAPVVPLSSSSTAARDGTASQDSPLVVPVAPGAAPCPGCPVRGA